MTRPNKVQKLNTWEDISNQTVNPVVDTLHFLVVYLQLITNHERRNDRDGDGNLLYGLEKADVISLVTTNSLTLDCYLKSSLFNWTFNIDMWPEFINAGQIWNKNLKHFNRLVVTQPIFDCGVITKDSLMLFEDLRVIQTNDKLVHNEISRMLQELYTGGKLKPGRISIIQN